ncbi:McrC family protein [Glycomyces buryatensis]|uniref:PE-PGRS family protein n=1 Tax=Glycomyces buryatensis TaxID=2570927 RepID=A0A4S8QCA0_9ACTN|nr:PE-PGRS family protein [Glycomyces buryatensis]THV42147.1 PE-PGRS family protein [Glycomyces buryatensis]
MNSGSTAIRTIRTGEYRRIDLDAALVGPADRLRLESLAGRGLLGLEDAGAKLRLTFKAAVGVIVLGAYRIVVEPKFAFDGTRLIEWMCYALKVDPPLDDLRRRWMSADTGFFDLIAFALVAECRQLARAGLRRDYRRRESVESVLRGSLDFGRQVSRRFGQVDRLHVRHFDRDDAIWENQACHTALCKAARLANHPDLALEAAALAKAFPRTDNLRSSAAALRRARYTRANRRYRPAHAWARMLLNDESIGDLLVDSGATADAFILDMNKLWEAVVKRMVADAVAPMNGSLIPAAGPDRVRVQGDVGNASSFLPDALVGFAGVPDRIPVDAKYKRYAKQGTSASDVHQLTTYAQAYATEGEPCALIIYPEPGRAASRELTVSGPAGVLARITLCGIDTELASAQAATILDAWLKRHTGNHVQDPDANTTAGICRAPVPRQPGPSTLAHLGLKVW